jgi:hypothetical protein
MLIDNSENKNIDKRCVRKEFKCQSCFRFFKKLVQILIEHIQCPFCYSDNCKVIANSNDNDSIGSDNSSLKTDEEEEKEDKIKIKNKNENNNNNINEEKKNYSFLNRKKLLQSIKPFSVSPFATSIHRHKFDINDIVEDGILTTVNENFFIDNYCSNFVSNFDNPLGRIIFIQMQIKNNSEIKSIPPLSAKEIRQIQKFEMSTNYCKVSPNDKNNFELPNCIYCLKDILLETNCFLLRCGHLLHDNCLYDWVKQHKICPVCKFPIIQKGCVRKSSLDIILDDTIKEEAQIEKKISKISQNVNNEENKINNNNNFVDNNNKNIIDITQLIDNENSNINIIGEKKCEMELLFDEVKK